MAIAFVLAILYIVFLFYTLVKNQFTGLYLCIFSAPMFFGFKHGFVRSDGHIYFFFTTYLMLIGIILLFYFKNVELMKFKSENKFHLSKVIMIGLIGAMVFIPFKCLNVSIGQIKNNFLFKLNYVSEVKNTLSMDYYVDQKHMKLSDAFLEIIGDETVTIYPIEQSYALYNDLNYIPMTLIQAYSAYTPFLDEKNAACFASDSRPQYIILSLDVIDGRLPFIEVPTTFNAILSNYNVVSYDTTNQILLLEAQTDEKQFNKNFMETKISSYEDDIMIPHVDSGSLVIANIQADQSILGKWLTFFIKTPPVIMELLNADGEIVKSGRVIVENLNNPDGIIISDTSYLETPLGFINLINEGASDNNITSVRFTGPGLQFYKEEIAITFYSQKMVGSGVGVDFLTANQSDQLKWDTMSKIESTPSVCVDYFILDNNQLQITGWAINNDDQKVPSDMYILIGNQMFDTKRVDRQDVAEHMGINDPVNLHYGYSTFIDINDITSENLEQNIKFVMVSPDRKSYGIIDDNRNAMDG